MLDGYIICGTPRSGSTLLCDLLASTGVAGKPDSFFWAPSLAEWAEEWGLPGGVAQDDAAAASAYLAAAIAAGTGGTGVFGLRLMYESLVETQGALGLLHPGPGADAQRFERAFGRLLYIHLFREDKLAQAVSLVKAEQTGLWHVAPDGSELERLSPPQEPRYDFGRIDREVKRLGRHDTGWVRWFEAQGLSPLRLSYERLSADPGAAVVGICAALGVMIPEAWCPKAGVARLSDETSRDWIGRYRQDLARSA